ncbi:MAG: hypothetical protein M1819_006628 [Sarea resinae]|nr:MAG: hypothetical protein M1819_006628 [Sarea resinae]
MVFYAPTGQAAELPYEVPESLAICEFLWTEHYERNPLGYSRPPFVCGLSGKEYSALEVRDRVDHLARSLSTDLGWHPNESSEWDKVVAIFGLNTIDTPTLAWAVHRLSGIVTPINAAYSAPEVTHQLKASGAKALFTCVPLLPLAREAAQQAGIPQDKVYLIDLPVEITGQTSLSNEFKTVNQLIQAGEKLPRLEALKWAEHQGSTQVAFLSYSSGTSGLPKGVMVSHRNIICNVLQITAQEKPYRDTQKGLGNVSDYTEIQLGLLPQSHIYGLTFLCHLSAYRGDSVIVFPKFELQQILNSVQQFRINTLFLVPPIIIAMTKNKKLVDKYDLSSVTCIYTGAAPLGVETAEEVHQQYPSWKIRQGYGLTESSPVISSTPHTDIVYGSSGCLLPLTEARLVSLEGNEITGYDQPGELLVKAPNVVLGYYENEKATRETFQDGWLRTGDEVLIRKSPQGNEHIFVIDRIKELIKVKGFQVAPAELEDHLLSHHSVADAAVVPIPDDKAGELPKAFIVKSPSVGIEENERVLKRDISKWVEEHMAKYKWLRGGIEFVDAIPRSPSGKILRRLLRDQHPGRKPVAKM